ncbi:MAG: hypothetical protein NC394_10655 [Bacteroides sp.]|nr:hypothetical protein [Bacteroides sp.]
MNEQYERQTQPASYTASAAKKRRAEAVNVLGGRVADVMKTNPVLAVIERSSDVVSYIVTGASALFTALAVLLGHQDIVLGYIALIFGFFALSKKNALPLAAALSSLSFFKLVCFIGSVAGFAAADRQAFFSVGFVVSFVFSIFELAVLGYFTFITWTYFTASLPARPKPRVSAPSLKPARQPLNDKEISSERISENASEQASENVPASETAAKAEDGENAAQNENISVSASVTDTERSAVSAPDPVSAPIRANAAPVLKPLVSSPPVKRRVCALCGTENTVEAAFCKQCGNKL